jgi:hypothetical protein
VVVFKPSSFGLCDVVVGYHCFGGPCCLHLQGEVDWCGVVWCSVIEWHGPLKRRYPTTQLHGVTTQKTST